MKLGSIITAEKVIKEELQKDPTKDIFPITLIKFLLNRKKIINFFERIDQTNIQDLTSYIDFDHKRCDACINNSRKMLCRKHTSIERVTKTNQACLDTDTGIFIYMNEIFKWTKNIDDNNKLAIIYTPHTKLIQGSLTEYKVKKISTISTYTPQTLFSPRIEINTFSSNKLAHKYIKCWFNNEFSLITIPGEEATEDTSEVSDSLFCLIPNK